MFSDGNIFLVLSIAGASRTFLIADNPATGLIFPVLILVIAVWTLFTSIQKRGRLMQRLSPGPTSQASLGMAMRPEIADIYLKKLADLMDRERPFLDGNLTLPVVAKNLGISPDLLSETLNGRLGQSFVDYINSRRIAEVQKLLLDPRSRHKSIITLAFEAGFNSKTAFNRVFKQSVGMTPSEFRRQVVNTVKEENAEKRESLPVSPG